MPTRTEAAEALYRAAMDYMGVQITSPSLDVAERRKALDGALVGYQRATPTPLPAEVARVLEAAEAFERRWIGPVLFSDCVSEGRDVVEAIRAYRSTQPEPLSARLARLRPGSVVRSMYEGDPNKYTVLANHPQSKTIFVTWDDGECAAAFDYSVFDRAILSEPP